MNKKIYLKIKKICEENNIEMLDLNSIMKFAIQYKLYDIISYLNNNTNDYLTTIKAERPKK